MGLSAALLWAPFSSKALPLAIVLEFLCFVQGLHLSRVQTASFQTYCMSSSDKICKHINIVKRSERTDNAAITFSLFFRFYLPAAPFIILSNVLWEVSVEVEERRPPLSGGLVLWKV